MTTEIGRECLIRQVKSKSNPIVDDYVSEEEEGNCELNEKMNQQLYR